MDRHLAATNTRHARSTTICALQATSDSDSRYNRIRSDRGAKNAFRRVTRERSKQGVVLSFPPLLLCSALSCGPTSYTHQHHLANQE